MKKMKLIMLLFVVTFAVVYCQPDKEFKTPIKVVSIIYPDGTIQTTASGTAVTWSTLAGKPVAFPPESHTHDYADLTNKPEEVELQEALSSLPVIVIPKKTTAEIAAMTPTAGSFVYDVTLNVLKIYSGSVWKTLITAN